MRSPVGRARLAVVFLLALPLTLLAWAEGTRLLHRTEVAQTDPSQDPSTQDVQRVRENELRFLAKTRRELHPRPEPTWWPDPDRSGLRGIGHVAIDELSRHDLIVMPNNRGSFLSGRPVRREASEMLRPTGRRGEPLDAEYHIVQLRDDLGTEPSASTASAAGGTSRPGHGRIRSLLESKGFEVVEYVPRNAFLVRVPAGSADRLLDAEFQFSTPYGPADRIGPGVGTRPMLNPERAVSDQLELVARMMPGADIEALEARIVELGGAVLLRETV